MNNTMTFHQICAACATPPGQSGIAVIRLSGPGSALAVDTIFQPSGRQASTVQAMDGYTCALGRIVNPADQSLVDQVIVTRYTAPSSYTGEEVVEISCHGGIAVRQMILDLLFDQGVRPAEPGEFTRRAFMNGKLDLVQAEAVMDLIQAGAERASRVAAAQLDGALSDRIRAILHRLLAVSADLEMILEFPEHEDSPDELPDLFERLRPLHREIAELAASYRQGRLLREGLSVVIAGRPNAGKSSLLNALTGFDRAIVTPVPGTTRDTVEVLIDIEGLPVRLVDTAGLRETDDVIEKFGVERTRDALKNADLVFWLISPPIGDLAEEAAAVEAVRGREVIVIAGKEDLAESQGLLDQISTIFAGHQVLSFSVHRPEGLASLREAILACYENTGSGRMDSLIITSQRHQQVLLEAAASLEQAITAAESRIAVDMIASLIRACAETLASLTGEQISQQLVDTIFSRFCVGK